MKGTIVVIILALLMPELGFAIDFKQAKFTQVINDVQIIDANQVSPAAVDTVFKMPDILRTGPDSRAELVGADDTITRVGANTIFSFDPAERTIDLQQGSLLFHSPHGKGGGTIHTATATASVLGTTLIVSTTPNGGMKVLDLEGSVAIKFLNGFQQSLEPGQMTFVLPGGTERAPIIIFRLDQQTKTSALVKGFTKPLASMPLINHQIANQLKLIQSGHAVDTTLVVGAEANASQVQVAFEAEPGNPDNPPAQNTTVQNPYQAPADNALSTETVTINGPLLQSITPNLIFPAFDITGNTTGDTFLADDVGNPFHGFAANTININTPTIDLSAYAGDALGPYFDIVAMDTIDIEGSGVTFTGLDPSDELILAAGNQLLIASGATVEANTGLFELEAQSAISLSGVTLENNLGDLYLYSPDDISLTAGSSVSAAGLVGIGYGPGFSSAVDIDSSTISAGSIYIEAVDSVTVNNSTLTSSSGNIDIFAEDNTLDLEQSTINAAGDLEISSGGALTLGATAADTIHGVNVDISSGGAMDLEGSTITAASGMNITSDGALTLGTATADTIQAGASGVSIYSYGGDMDLERSTITAAGGVDIYSDGALTLGATINDTIQAGAGATLDAYGNITDYSTPINETGGDGINIDSYYGSLDVENCALTTAGSGDINITSSGPLELGVYQNLSSYAAAQTFTGYDVNIQSTEDAVSIYTTSINASDDITVNSVGTLTVDTLLSDYETPDAFTAGNSIFLTSSTGDVDLYDSTTLTATAGNVSLTSTAGAVNLLNSTINAANSSGATVTLSGANGVTVSGSTINTDPVNGAVSLTSTSTTGTVTVNNGTSITAGMLTVNSGDGILLDGSGGALNLNSSGGSINLTANQSGGLISVYDANLTSYGTVILSAHTVVLQDVSFALTSHITLDSFYGLPHFNSVAPGDVNFVSGDYDGNTLINSQAVLNGLSNITISQSPN